VPDIKLTSGPAIEETVAGGERELMAELRRRLAEADAAEASAAAAAARACCDSPLATQARDQGWPFCPACGQAP
jgi:hypothetical protein